MRFTFASAVSSLVAISVLPSCVVAATQSVMVGMNGQLVFSPSNITAQMGDTIDFMFMSPGKNHSVTQSAFTTPCVPLPDGVNSGFLPVPSDANFTTETAPTWSMIVNTTSPIWIHCAQTVTKSHCQNGMVFSINATPQKTFADFLANAKNSSTSGGSSIADASSNNASGGNSNTPQAEDNSPTNGSLKVAISKRAIGLCAFASMIGAMLF